MYYTYMLRCEDNSIYTGITTDPERRLKEHVNAGRKAAGYTRSHKAQGFLIMWQSVDRSAASRLEYMIKTLSKAQKERLASTGCLDVLGNRLDISQYTPVFQNSLL